MSRPVLPTSTSAASPYARAIEPGAPQVSPTPRITLAVTPPSPLPVTGAVRELLDGLVEAAVSAEATTVRARSSTWQGLCVPLTRENGILAGAVLGDADFARAAHAGLGGQPDPAADEPLSDEEVAAAREVLEALEATMNSQTTPHVSSEGYHLLPGELPGPVGALLAYPYSQREFVVTFGEYGKGRLTALIW